MQSSRVKTVLRSAGQIALIFAVSVFVLIERGVTMGDPSFFLPLACFSAVLVGPITIESYRRNPSQPTVARLRSAVLRAAGAVFLIVAVSLILVNVFLSPGHLIAPVAAVCFWALALSLTAATASAAILALLVTQISLSAAQWGFRAMMLCIVVVYRSFLMDWTVSWYGMVEEWGLTPVVFAWWFMLFAIAAAALFWLSKRQAALKSQQAASSPALSQT